MELTTIQIKDATRLLMSGSSYQEVAVKMQIPLWVIRKVSGIVLKHTAPEDVVITTDLKDIKETEDNLFKAIDAYHLNPTLENSAIVDNYKVIYSRQKAF